MNPRTAGIGRAPARREVADVVEPRTPDRRLDQLLHVRKQRLGRFERERNEARQDWRAQRRTLSALKGRWRAAHREAHEQWRISRAAYSAMSISSGEFKKAKAVYERMRKQASQLRVEWERQCLACRTAGKAYFAARLVVLQANRQQEKLGVLRDEVRALEAARNMQA